MTHATIRRTFVLATIAAVVLAPAFASTADAARRSTVILNTDKAAPLAGYTVGHDGQPRLGVHLANTPGGFYMGRLFKGGTAFSSTGQTFDRHTFSYNGQTGDVYHSDKSQYAWGYAVGRVGACLWIGPSNGEPAHALSDYLSPSTQVDVNRCSQSQIDFLKGASGGNIGSHFNCDPYGGANFGTRKPLNQTASLYYNIQWSGSSGYDGGALVDYAGAIPAGTTVYYRYTTRDRSAINVYVPGSGWGFMPIGVLDRSRTGYYHRPGNPYDIAC